MCGIVAFLGNRAWRDEPKLTWLERCTESCRGAEPELERATRCLDVLEASFEEFMSYGAYGALLANERVRAEVLALTNFLGGVLSSLESERIAPASERIVERLRDYVWQLSHEFLGAEKRTARLVPADAKSAPQRYVAWCTEQVLENLERLEVRGRDSAGFCVQLELSEIFDPETSLDPGRRAELAVRSSYDPDSATRISLWRSRSGRPVVTFSYKVASIIGRLGDNTHKLAQMLEQDAVFWAAAEHVERIAIVAHTRWASNGVISIANCHPLDARVIDPGALDADADATFVLNGDVDNCDALREEIARKARLDARVTTDAKVPALLLRFETSASAEISDRLASVIESCAGSLATVMQHPEFPEQLFLARKGSGQDLFYTEVRDGWLVASETYGLVSRARKAFAVAGTDAAGAAVTLSVAPGRSSSQASSLRDRATLEPPLKALEIFTRDIYRGDFEYYLLKELSEAPRSIERTLRGKYDFADGKLTFREQGEQSFGPLLQRLRSRSEPAIDTILVAGQGTASIAAMAIAHLLRRALDGSKISVESSKSSELLSFGRERSFGSTLLIPVSQSGTTTDTNRTVDLMTARGAWVHAIVNRRESWLATHAHSRTFTSDGRDVEMAVASTKAFYSQVAAGKILALLLGHELAGLKATELMEEVERLEMLPGKVREILAAQETIAESAAKHALGHANWAVVGNGPNKIAAEEIRIKLSELCYKSIPCDFTEDKKHIDLSTEPLTLVVANDLPESVVSDTVKEVAIFRAHGGAPLVLCARGESRFTPYATQVLELPHVGAGLDFVLATVAGHLWGLYAARAIDDKGNGLRLLRAELSELTPASSPAAVEKFSRKLHEVLAQIESGEMNAGMSPATAVALATLHTELLQSKSTVDARFLARAASVLNSAVERMTRPIDSIRHQAKTVTVGISRPQEPLAESLRDALRRCAIDLEDLQLRDLLELRAISPLVTGVRGGVKYRIVAPYPLDERGAPLLQAVERLGFSESKPSRYDSEKPAQGSKRAALRLKHLVWGSDLESGAPFVIVPVLSHESKASFLLLLHVEFASAAPMPLKLEVLRKLGSRYDEFVERAEESPGKKLEALLERVTPAELVTAPVPQLK